MLFLSVRGFLDYAGPINPLAINVVVVLPSSLPERCRRPETSVFRSSIARPTDTSVYASSDTSRCRLQDSRPGWSRCLLSCRALSSPTTCRFTPAHYGIPTTRSCGSICEGLASPEPAEHAVGTGVIGEFCKIHV